MTCSLSLKLQLKASSRVLPHASHKGFLVHDFFLKNYSSIDGYEAEENAKLTSRRSVVISTQCVNGLCTIKFLFGFSIKTTAHVQTEWTFFYPLLLNVE